MIVELYLNFPRRRLMGMHLQRVRSKVDLVLEHHKFLLQALFLHNHKNKEEEKVACGEKK